MTEGQEKEKEQLATAPLLKVRYAPVDNQT